MPNIWQDWYGIKPVNEPRLDNQQPEVLLSQFRQICPQNWARKITLQLRNQILLENDKHISLLQFQFQFPLVRFLWLWRCRRFWWGNFFEEEDYENNFNFEGLLYKKSVQIEDKGLHRKDATSNLQDCILFYIFYHSNPSSNVWGYSPNINNYV